MEARLKVAGGRMSANRMKGVRDVLKVSKLYKSVKNSHTRRACVEDIKC